MNLLRAEWSRLFARRFTQVMLLVVVGLLTVVGLAIAVDSQPPSPDSRAKAARLAQAERERLAADLAACEEATADPAKADPDRYPPGVTCAEMFNSQWVQEENFVPHSFNFAEEAPSLILVFGAVFAMAAFAIGASFIGAEWSSGALMNLLTWRPRRLTVLLTKLGALLGGLTVAGVVIGAAWIGVLYTVASLRGVTGDPSGGLLTSMALADVRAIALALGTATVGFGLASIGRHTATALGVAIGWAVVMEFGLLLVLLANQVRRPERFLGSSYVQAWLDKKAEFWDASACGANSNYQCRPVQWSLDMGDSALVLGITMLLVLGAALVVMRRRDVT